MYKNDNFEIAIMNENREKRYHCKNSCRNISYKRVFFKLVGIKPKEKNINREKEHGFKRHIASENDRQKIEYEVSRQLCMLTYKSIQHGFSRSINQVLLTVIKAIDNITTSDS